MLTHVHKHTYTHMNMLLCMHLYTCTHTQLCTNTLAIPSHVHTYACTHTCSYTQIYSACTHTTHTHTLTSSHTCTCTHAKKAQSSTLTSLGLLPSPPSLTQCSHTHSCPRTCHICAHTNGQPLTCSHTLGCHATIHTLQTQAAIFKMAHPLIKSSFFILHINWPTSASLFLPTQ